MKAGVLSGSLEGKKSQLENKGRNRIKYVYVWEGDGGVGGAGNQAVSILKSKADMNTGHQMARDLLFREG